MDTPAEYFNYIRDNNLYDGTLFTSGEQLKEKRLWYKWIMVAARDEKRRFVGIADGALILNSELSVFYASHIAIDPKFRNQGLGTVFSAAILQAAENETQSGRVSLGLPVKGDHSSPQLTCELGEIEFPDPSFMGEGSMQRLTFHGRLGRQVIWPFRYAQPDTDYHYKVFNPQNWNSVPMFLAFRSFKKGNNNILRALEAAELLYDYFVAVMGAGAEWDKENMKKGMIADGWPSFVPFPNRRDSVNEFISKTGELKDLLKSLYPGHRFTLDYFENRLL